MKSEPAPAPVELSVQAIRSLKYHDTFSPTQSALLMEAGLLSLFATPFPLYLQTGDLFASLLWGVAAGFAGMIFCGIAHPIAHWLLNLFRVKEAARYQLSEELLAYGFTSATLAAVLYGPLHVPRIACALLGVSALFAAHEVKNFRKAAREDFAGYTPLRSPMRAPAQWTCGRRDTGSASREPRSAAPAGPSPTTTSRGAAAPSRASAASTSGRSLRGSSRACTSRFRRPSARSAGSGRPLRQ